jgi:hypothetical protein
LPASAQSSAKAMVCGSSRAVRLNIDKKQNQMLKNSTKYLGLFFGTASLILLIVIFLNPPTDFDGGPLLAHNLLFFFPMLIGIGILSILSIGISIKGFKKSKVTNNGLGISSIVFSSPGIIFFILILFRFFVISTEPEHVEMPEQIHNNSTSIVLNGKTIHLTGFNFGTDYQKRRVYISGIPYFNKEFKVQDAYFCQGNSEFELLYSNDYDSVYVYIPNSEPMYHYVNKKSPGNVPVRAIQLNSQQMDSLKSLNSKAIKQFTW